MTCGCTTDIVCGEHEDALLALYGVPCSFCGSDGHSGDQHAHDDLFVAEHFVIITV